MYVYLRFSIETERVKRYYFGLGSSNEPLEPHLAGSVPGHLPLWVFRVARFNNFISREEGGTIIAQTTQTNLQVLDSF